MKEYSSGMKGAAIVVHQMFFIVMLCSLYGAGYVLKERSEGMGCLSLLAVIGLVGSFVLLAYLTSVAGRRSEEDEAIYLNAVDYVYTDVQLVLFVAFVYLGAYMGRGLRELDFALSGLLVTVGTVGYLADAVFLIFYLSMVRRSKTHTLLTHSLCYKLCHFLGQIFIGRQKPGHSTRKGRERYEIQRAIESIAAGALDTHLDEAQFHGQERDIAAAVNHIREGLSDAVLEKTRNERMKADLITNVSHDIKTPLTSIVNYVDLLKRENLENEKAQGYIRILDEKSQRLKQLTEDLVEVSRISSGNVKLDMQNIDLVELICQTGGEFNERFEERELTIVTKLPHRSVMVRADGRQLYRVIGNLYTNAAKYALEKTRVYVELEEAAGQAVFSIKNISKTPLPGDTGKEDLTERFVRGETSRTTEGSGLGLSIAKNLTNLMGGEFRLKLDGDLFIATISLHCMGAGA
ncbi:MAG: HAMP domain-containing histidine kinase [Muribaculaceae bacterium]|nr:HAMP domain-containing histidine kinase [Roseburia sp.]MCM1431656.1 HAMP domain-containing histidine kinase [Muribaculaceae bacterium]MCM1491672.1 HAMP domain-containing histidine kinase [Muribaculaceae bacterium]